jgi:hypothetical protein
VALREDGQDTQEGRGRTGLKEEGRRESRKNAWGRR